MSEFVFGLGCEPSFIDGSEYIFEEAKNLYLPTEYSYKEQMSPVLNQGNTNMCVTYSTAAHLDWNINMDRNTATVDNHIDRNQIYSVRGVKGDNGMTFKEALGFLKHTGVKSDIGTVKIDYYAKIGGEVGLKQALITNGPCVGGMMVYNDGYEFWNKRYGDKTHGGHAISIIGWTSEGFIIRNSWGPNWAYGGYSILKYKDFDKMFEIWTIID